MLIQKELEQLVKQKEEESLELERVLKVENKNRDAKKKYENIQKSLILLREIVEYVSSCEWLRVDAAARYKFHLEYDRKALIKKELEEIGITAHDENYEEMYKKREKTIKVVISAANKRLRSKIGYETLRLIREGQIADAKASFYLASGRAKLTDYIEELVLDGLPSADSKFKYRYSIMDCMTQIDYLYSHSKYKVEQDKQKAIEDEEKMAWVLNEIKDGNTQILGLIMGKVDYQWFIDKIKEKHQIK